MARPRSFDIDQAVDKAMQVFWTHGYEGASLPDLLDGMGLTRGSLYKAFTDKKTLFLRVLDLYEVQAVQAGVTLLSDPAIPNGADRIIEMFHNSYRAVTHGDRRGCLICTAATGPSTYDDDIAASVARALARMRDGIETALQASPKHVDLSQDDRRALADMLTAQYMGLRTMARGRVDVATMRNAVRAVAQMLA